MQYLRIEKLSKAIASLAALLLPSAALAISTLQPKLRDQEIRLGLQAKSYLTQSAESASDQGTGNASFSLGLRGIGEEGSFHFGAEAETLIGVKGANIAIWILGRSMQVLRKSRLPSASLFLWEENDSTGTSSIPSGAWVCINQDFAGTT